MIIPKIIKTDKFDRLVDYILCSNIALYILTTVWSHSCMLRIAGMGNILHKLMWLTFIIVILKCVYDFLRGKFTFIESIIFFVLALFGFYVRKCNGGGEPLLLVLYIAACKNINRDLFLKFSFYGLIISCMVPIIISFIPGFNTGTVTQVRYGVTKVRYGLGFEYTTFFPNFLFGIQLLSFLVIKKYTNLHYILFLAIQILVFILTDTKSVFIYSTLALILHFIITRLDNKIMTEIIGKLNIIIYPIGAVFIYIISKFYFINSPIINFINKLVTGRVALAAKGLSLWPVTIFGQPVTFSTGGEKGYTIIDIAYINILVRFGIIFLLFTIFIYMVFSYSAYKLKDKSLIIVLFILGLHVIFDPQLIMLAYTPFIALTYNYFIECRRIK